MKNRTLSYWFAVTLFPLTLFAKEPPAKKLDLKPAAKDADANRLQAQSREPASPVRQDKGLAVDCVDSAGITHKSTDPGYQKCLDAMPSPAMNGAKRTYEGAPKNPLNNSNPRTVQGVNELPSVQVRD